MISLQDITAKVESASVHDPVHRTEPSPPSCPRKPKNNTCHKRTHLWLLKDIVFMLERIMRGRAWRQQSSGAALSYLLLPMFVIGRELCSVYVDVTMLEEGLHQSLLMVLCACRHAPRRTRFDDCPVSET